jgi:ketosteroid isomerase-like protein
MTDDQTPTDEAPIRAQIDVFANAFRVKDVDAIMSVFAPDVVSFDLVPPLACTGAAALRQHWEKTFAHYSGSTAYEIHDLSVTIGDEVAFTRSLNRKSGTLTTGETSEQWLRWTACFRKVGDIWLVTHEHVSVPMDPVSGEALVDLTP